jgi:hypothetical protein
METVSALISRGAGDQDQSSISFKTGNLTLDPIGAAFLARAVPWEIGDQHSFDIFTGSGRFHLALSAISSAIIRHNGVDREALVLKPQLRDLTFIRPESNLRDALIYLSRDPEREILKFSCSMENCSVSGTLDSFRPLVSPQNSHEAAQAVG